MVVMLGTSIYYPRCAGRKSAKSTPRNARSTAEGGKGIEGQKIGRKRTKLLPGREPSSVGKNGTGVRI